MRIETMHLAKTKSNRFRVTKRFKTSFKHDKHPRLHVDIPVGLVVTLNELVEQHPIFFGWLHNRCQAPMVILEWMRLNSARYTREQAADYFYLLMTYEGVKWIYRYPLYLIARWT